MHVVPKNLLRCAFWLTLAAALPACVTPRVNDDGLPTVDDPDPDTDPGGPQFCNMNGKAGDELAKCRAQNASLYQEFDDEAKKREPWFDFTPDGWSSSTELDGAFVVPVTKEKEAVAKLEAAPFVALTATDVEFFTGKRAASAGRTPYLVRGLLYFRATGAFKIFTKDQAILVQHDSQGLDAPQETRSAVVVFLTAAPSHVYVQCGVLE